MKFAPTGKMRLKFIGSMCMVALACGALLLATGCSQKKEEKKVVELKPTRPVQKDTVVLQKADIAMVARSLVDEMNMGTKLDSATYDMRVILTDGQGKPLYMMPDSVPGDWSVHVEDPQCVTIRNLHLGNLLAEDLRIYIASALGLTDSDVVEAGLAMNTKNTQAVVYMKGDKRLEITMTPENDANGVEHVWMTVTIIKVKDRKK